MSTETGDTEPSIEAHDATRRRSDRMRPIALWLSIALCGLISVLYIAQWDVLSAITFFPPWMWTVPGIALLLLGRSPCRKRLMLAVVLVWALFVACFAEEPRSLLRFGAWPDPDWVEARQAGQALRVVSLNCAVGNEEPAMEVAAYEPDIVLFQESPRRSVMPELARRILGPTAQSFQNSDTAILARGTIEPISESPVAPGYVRANVRLDSGLEMQVICLRLTPPIVRVDLWSPRCWSDHATDSRKRRRQLNTVVDELQNVPAEVPLIVGGDFNKPAHSGVLRLIKPYVRDTFSEAGRGWGHTAINQFPVHRVDQVWINARFEAVTVVARKTQHSDHRMVVCDLMLLDPAPAND